MKWTSRIAALMATLAMAGAVQAAGIQQAFLVQNSGWMEPFYTDPQSQLKALVGAVAQAASTPDDKLFVLAFSQSSGGNVSPALLGQGNGAAAIGGQLAPLQLARKGQGGGGALADTDFQEAVTKTITGPFRSAPGIIWIFTNNKNSPNNDSQTAERNRDFYRLLHLEPSIARTLVFPLRMPVQGKLYSAKGLMVYALAYGQPAADALNRIQAEGRLAKVLTRAPARLKPVDQDAVRIVPQAVQNSANVHASLGRDGRTIVLDVAADKLVPSVVLQASLQNMFFPYVIDSATVQASLGGQRAPLQVTPSAIKDLQPGASQQVEVRFDLPMAQIPSPWSAQALSAMGKQVLLPMQATVGLAGQKLALSSGFSAELQELFPGDPISEVFTPPASVRASQATVPLLVRIQYPLLPVLLIVGAVLLLVLAFVLLGLMSTRSKRYRLVVDGVARQVLLKPFKSLIVRDDNGRDIGELKRGLGQPSVVRVAEGHTVVLG